MLGQGGISNTLSFLLGSKLISIMGRIQLQISSQSHFHLSFLLKSIHFSCTISNKTPLLKCILLLI